MRLLASAFSCCPGHGSEPGVGWNTVEQLAKEHEVWVLVDVNWRTRVEMAFDQRQHPNPTIEDLS
jgi:allantoicase